MGSLCVFINNNVSDRSNLQQVSRMDHLPISEVAIKFTLNTHWARQVHYGNIIICTSELLHQLLIWFWVNSHSHSTTICIPNTHKLFCLSWGDLIKLTIHFLSSHLLLLVLIIFGVYFSYCSLDSIQTVNEYKCFTFRMMILQLSTPTCLPTSPLNTQTRQTGKKGNSF